MPDIISLRFGEAVNTALRHALKRWPESLLYGEDVGKPGGVFGVTRRLKREFGDRVFDTPISESAIIGSAVGAAMMGRRPIVEIMWIDFTLVGLDQVINQAANVRYISKGALTAPITIRTQQGATPGSCAQHSQSLEALFTHIPGLRVCIPSTPQDAYDLLLSAVACDDPTLVIEARGLYNGEKQDVQVGGEESLPWPADSFDAALAQLVVNFMSDADAGIAEMRRVVRPGGMVAACTWDYSGGMTMLRTFWDAALSLDSEAPDEARTMRYNDPDALRELWLRAGLEVVENDALVIEASYRDFDDYWGPFTGGVGPAGAYTSSLDPDRREALREECRRRLGDPEGAFTLTAKAWAVKGRA